MKTGRVLNSFAEQNQVKINLLIVKKRGILQITHLEVVNYAS